MPACYWNMQRGRVCISEWFNGGTALHSRQHACLAHKLTMQMWYVAPAVPAALSNRFCCPALRCITSLV